MAVTKVYAKSTRLDAAIRYILNGDKTDGQILTARFNCDPGWEYQQMMDTKRELGKTGGRLAYHIIQSYKPGEVTPELALEIAKGFAEKYLSDYEVVIGTHIDKGHIHNHILYNSVSSRTGKRSISTGTATTRKSAPVPMNCAGSTACPLSRRMGIRKGCPVTSNGCGNRGDSRHSALCWKRIYATPLRKPPRSAIFLC